MNIKQRTAMIFVLLLSLAISSCGPGLLFGPAVTPTQTSTVTPTSTPILPTSTPTSTPIPTDTPTPSWIGDFAEPILAAVQAHQPNLHEDFTTDNGSWKYYDSDCCKIANGVMNMQGINVSASNDKLRGKNFVISYEFTPRKADGGSNFHLIFRSSQGSDNTVPYDTLHFRAMTYVWHIWEQTNNIQGDPILIQHFETGDTDLHIVVAQTIKVTLIVKDDRAALYLDNKPADMVYVQELNGEYISFNLNSEQGPTSVDIDNVTFWNLDKMLP